MGRVPELSVVIPCLNEERYVGKLLRDLSLQTYRDFEVIVADSQSQDNTVQVVNTFADKLDLTVVSGERGASNTRNAGAVYAKGEWIMFLDADIRLPVTFLENLLTEAKQRELTLATTNFRIKNPNIFQRVGAFIGLRYCRAFERFKHPIMGGFCVLVRRDIHEKIEGFNQRVVLGEDLDYAGRAIAAGARFRYVTSTYLYYSLRRYQKEGYLRLTAKNLYYEVYRRIKKFDVERKGPSYEFGHYDDVRD